MVWSGKQDLPAQCQDVLFIGSRGSGEPYSNATNGLGPEVYQSLEQLKAQLGKGETSKARIASVANPYAAVKVNGPAGWANVVSGRYDDSVEQGVAWLAAALGRRLSQDCPDESIVLAGYSQGAAVVHRVLQRGMLPAGLADRVSGVLLLADADRRNSDVDVINRYGDATRTSIGSMAMAGDRTWGWGPPSKSSTERMCNGEGQVPCWVVHSACLKGDPICDFCDQNATSAKACDRVLLRKGIDYANDYLSKLGIHDTYRSVPPPAGVLKARNKLFSQTRDRVLQTWTTRPPASTGTCATGGPCRIGDRGPGGGIVFYAADSTQPWGRYLEAAPAGWSGGTQDPDVLWCPLDAAGAKSFLPTGTAIGTGRANTETVIAACGTDTAAGIATSYRGGGKSDWYLPSKDEMDSLIARKAVARVSGRPSDAWWTSSQVPSDITLPNGDSAADFAMCSNILNSDDWCGYARKYTLGGDYHGAFVRPIRAF